MDFELPEELRLLKQTMRTLRRPGVDPGRDAFDGRPDHEARHPAPSRSQGQEARAVESRRAGGIRRPGPQPARHGRGLGGDGAHHRAAAARAIRVRARREADPLHAERQAEGEISLSRAARREEHRLRAIRARRRLRPRRDANDRRPQGRHLCHQRLQALDHQRARRGFPPARRRDRPQQGQPRRPEHVPRRYEHARRQDRPPHRDHDGRCAVPRSRSTMSWCRPKT